MLRKVLKWASADHTRSPSRLITSGGSVTTGASYSRWIP
jgi:hypothetical protein